MRNSVAASMVILVASLAIDVSHVMAGAPFDSSGVQYQIVKFAKVSGAAGSPSSGATFTVEFPEFVGGATPHALSVINAFVRYYLPVSSGRQPGFTLDEMANRKMDLWRSMLSSNEISGLGISETFTVSVHYNRNGVLCLKFYWWSSGGAHPIDHTDYCNFEMVGGSRLALGDLLIEGYKPALDSLGEIEFRLKRSIGTYSSLKAAGYHFKEDHFSLNENFAIDSTGLLFHFNDYEITPHGAAPEVTLSLRALAGLMPRGGRLAKLSELQE